MERLKRRVKRTLGRIGMPISSREDLPPLPFVPGWRFVAQSHLPPATDSIPLPTSSLTPEQRAEREEMAQQKRCLKHPPLPGIMGGFTLDLQVDQPIRCGVGCWAQVFCVSVRGSSGRSPSGESIPRSGLVAKVFDPMYCDDTSSLADGFALMDYAYARETAAYRALREFQGTSIPQFYGSFSITIPAGRKTRQVRMILIGFVPGHSMYQLWRSLSPESASASQLGRDNWPSQATRKRIMKRIVELETTIFAKGVSLDDLAPRNIIIQDPIEHGNIFFIDFADVTFLSEHARSTYSKSLNRWRTIWQREFLSFVDWHWDTWFNHEFGYSEALIAEEMKLLPPKRRG